MDEPPFSLALLHNMRTWYRAVDGVITASPVPLVRSMSVRQNIHCIANQIWTTVPRTHRQIDMILTAVQNKTNRVPLSYTQIQVETLSDSLRFG